MVGINFNFPADERDFRREVWKWWPLKSRPIENRPSQQHWTSPVLFGHFQAWWKPYRDLPRKVRITDYRLDNKIGADWYNWLSSFFHDGIPILWPFEPSQPFVNKLFGRSAYDSFSPHCSLKGFTRCPSTIQHPREGPILSNQSATARSHLLHSTCQTRPLLCTNDAGW